MAVAAGHGQQAGQEMAEQLARAAHGLSQAEETNAQTIGQLAADDWIPDYPPPEDGQE